MSRRARMPRRLPGSGDPWWAERCGELAEFMSAGERDWSAIKAWAERCGEPFTLVRQMVAWCELAGLVWWCDKVCMWRPRRRALGKATAVTLE